MRIYLSLVFGLIRESCFVLTCSIQVPIYPDYHCCCCSRLAEETFWCPNMLSLVSFAGITVLWIGTLNGGPVQGESPTVWLKNHIYKLIPEHQYVIVPTLVSFTEKTAFIKKRKKKNPYLPYLNFLEW